jgi:hypothetical protein
LLTIGGFGGLLLMTLVTVILEQPEGPHGEPTRPHEEPTGPHEQPPPGIAPESLIAYEDIIRRELEPGAVLYNPSKRMRVGQVERVEVRIARERSDQFFNNLEGRGEAQVEELLIGTVIKAELRGEYFDIVPIDSTVQQLRASGFREWRWNVLQPSGEPKSCG